MFWREREIFLACVGTRSQNLDANLDIKMNDCPLFHMATWIPQRNQNMENDSCRFHKFLWNRLSNNLTIASMYFDPTFLSRQKSIYLSIQKTSKCVTPVNNIIKKPSRSIRCSKRTSASLNIGFIQYFEHLFLFGFEKWEARKEKCRKHCQRSFSSWQMIFCR